MSGGPNPKRVVFNSFGHSLFTERVAEGNVFAGSLPSMAALFACILAGWEEKCAGHFFISRFRCSLFRD